MTPTQGSVGVFWFLRAVPSPTILCFEKIVWLAELANPATFHSFKGGRKLYRFRTCGTKLDENLRDTFPLYGLYTYLL